MSDFDDRDLDEGEERRVAVAEYVLGLGSASDRAAMARAIETVPALADEARFWEARFAAFNDDYLPADPPSGLLDRVEQRLFAPAPKAAWYDSLRVWRSLAAAAATVAVLAVGLNLFTPAPRLPADTAQLVAALQPVEGDVSFVARYDAGAGVLRVKGTGASAGAGSDYELWFIAGEEAPISMGVVSIAEGQAITVDETLRDRLVQDITLAVTREIAGGSPTGAPQGPIVAAGPVAAI